MEGVEARAREDCRELSLDIESATVAGFDNCRDSFRGLAATGEGLGLRTGSALDKILEKAIGSAGRLGVWFLHVRFLLGKWGWTLLTLAAAGCSCFTTGPPMTTLLCRATGEFIVAILGDCEMEDCWTDGCECEGGDRG